MVSQLAGLLTVSICYSELRCRAERWGCGKHVCGKSRGPHTLAWVRLLLYVYIQTYNWKSCWSSCFRTQVDLLTLKSPPAAGWPPPVPCEALPCLSEAPHAGELWRENSWPWQPLAVLCYSSTRAVCCCLSREQPEGRGPGVTGLRDSQCRASKVQVCRYGYEMLGKGKGARSHYRQAQFPARMMTDLSPTTDSLFNNRLTKFFWAFLVLKGHCPKQLKGQPTYPILAALFDLLFLWRCLGYPPPHNVNSFLFNAVGLELGGG